MSGNKIYTIKEYDSIIEGSEGEDKIVQNKNNLVLPKTTFSNLQNVVLSYKDKQSERLHSSQIDNKSDNQLPLEVAHKKLKARNYVGSICLDQDTQIEILPKIYLGHDDKSSSAEEKTRKHFLEMLKVYLGENYLEFGNASLDKKEMTLLEVFIFTFLNLVESLIKSGLGCTYISQEDNLNCLKGKINFPNHLRYNLIHQERFYVEFDEFSIDRPINRVIKQAILSVRKFTQNIDNYRLINRIIPHFDKVRDIKDWKHELNISNIDRSINTNYKNALNWAEFILDNVVPINWSGTQDIISLLFPMEKVFEYYVADKLWTHFTANGSSDISFELKRKSEIMKESNGNMTFSIIPDIVFESKKHPKHYLIMDTKWKEISKNNPELNKYVISIGDIYQLYSYGRFYQKKGAKEKSTRIFLLYPRNENFKEGISFSESDKDLPSNSTYNNQENPQDLSLHIVPIDLPELNEATKIIDTFRADLIDKNSRN